MIGETLRASARSFQWRLAATGIWLVLSPYVLFSQETLSRGASDHQSLTFMAVGIVALLLSGNDALHPMPARAGPVAALGGLLIAAPIYLGFAGDVVAVVNAWLAGLTMIALVAWEVLTSGRNHTTP